MRYILIAVVSQDGFIARFSGHKPYEWSSKEEQNLFNMDVQKCSWGIMGKTTHELEYNENRSRVIFTSSVNQIVKKQKHIFFNPKYNDFSQVVKYFQPNDTIGILGGTKVNDFFWNKKFITDIILTIEPIVFKKGLLLLSNINWTSFKNEIKNNCFQLKREKLILNKRGTVYLHYTR